MADLEGMARLREKIMYCEDPERRQVYINKLEKLKYWQHPRVTAKLKELALKQCTSKSSPEVSD